MSGLPGSITGTFLSLYFESSSKTVNIALFFETGTNGAHRYDLSIDRT
jgi:hexokinase